MAASRSIRARQKETIDSQWESIQEKLALLRTIERLMAVLESRDDDAFERYQWELTHQSYLDHHDFSNDQPYNIHQHMAWCVKNGFDYLGNYRHSMRPLTRCVAGTVTAVCK